MEFSWDEIIEMFNNNDLDVEKYFNDYGTFFSILKKRGLIDEIDPHNASDGEVWQNQYLIWLYKEDRKKFYEHVVKLLSGDLIMDDSGNIFLETTDRGSFSKLFCSGRNDISRDTIEQILSGEDAFDPYWDTTDDVYRDVIEELTPENDKKLQEYIVDILNGREVEPESEELELIASEQGHPDFAIITSENVKRIIDDGESMNYLLDNILDDLKSELYSIHRNSYSSAYEEQVYDDIFDKINEYFNGKGEWSSRPHTYKKDTMVEIFKIPVASNFDSVILDYLNDNKGYGTSGTLEYWGSYLSILDEYVDCLSVYPPDYPDSRLVDKNINMYFKDYL